MARPSDPSEPYPDEPRFVGVVAGFLAFSLLEKVARGLGRRYRGRDLQPSGGRSTAPRGRTPSRPVGVRRTPKPSSPKTGPNP